MHKRFEFVTFRNGEKGLIVELGRLGICLFRNRIVIDHWNGFHYEFPA